MKIKSVRTLVCILFLGLFFSSTLGYGEETAKTVKAVDVRGNKTVSTLTILAKVKTPVNQPLSSSVLNEDLKRLYGMGFFTDVRIEQEDFDNGVKVVFVVTEKPVLYEIKIEGAQKLKKDEIKKEMQSVVGDFVDQKRVFDDVEAIKRLYEKKGFSEARVDSSMDLNSNTNQVTLIIAIHEGLKLRVKEIRVTGNSSLKTGDILNQIKTKPSAWWGWFHSGFLKEDELSEDIERIKAYYDENGFSDVEVNSETETTGKNKEDGDVILKFIIKEGKKYLVGDVRFKQNGVAKNEEIEKAIQMKKDKPFSKKGLRMDVGNIQDLYFDKGYLSAQIRSESIYNESTGRVDIVYTITENELNYVEQVLVQGNTKTKDIVIRRELRAYPGESFSGAKLKRSKERLYNLGYFEEVKFDTEDGSLPNTKNLVVTVKEAKTGEFSFGGGYSSVDSILGFAQIRQKNFDWQNHRTFTGAGQDFALRLELGGVRRNAELSFTEPWVFGYPYSFGFDLYRREFRRSHNAGYFFDQKRTGGNLRLGKEFSEYDKGLLIYKLEDVKISEIPSDASQALKDEAGSNVTSSLALTLTRDTRDNIFNPTRGYVISGTNELAGGIFGGDKNFNKMEGLGSAYFQHYNDFVLEFKNRVGVVNPYGKSEKVPIYERFFAGGGNTIRGYKERRVGPRDPGNGEPVGGEAYWVTNLEETFPIYPNLIKGAVFFDTGNVYEKTGDFGSGGVYSGVGAGVRVKTPIGPLKLDAGYPLDTMDGDKKSLRFYFNISQGF